MLFTGGCNFRCPFCYNGDLVKKPESLPKIEEGEVLELLRRRRKLYQAVVVTGGEPTMDDGLSGFLRKVKDMGFLTGLETNGTNPDVVGALIKEGLVDYIAMDVKAPLSFRKYRKAAGIKDRKLFENVCRSVKIVMGSGADYEFRTTVVPGLHTKEDIIELAGQLKGAKRYALQQFTPKETAIDKKMSDTTPYTDVTIRNIGDIIKGNFGAFETRNLKC